MERADRVRIIREAMRVLAEALSSAGPQSRELFVLSQLDTLVGQVATRAAALQVREIQVIDNGDGQGLRSVGRRGHDRSVLLGVGGAR